MKKHILALVILGILSIPAQATSILASSFGWNGIDDTQALYDAFTANVDTLYVDLQAGDWVSGPLIFDNTVNNKVVIFERDVKVLALAGAYNTYLYNGLFTFTNCSNVSLIGYGATLQMNKQEYIDLNDESEWRHNISLNGCSNFKIFGLELLDSGGDGIEISGIWQQPVPSTNIHIKDCRIDNNYRQGISVTSAQNVLIEHCEITNTSGTPPAFGIDLEPDNAYDYISNIKIKDCRITGNEGGGILLSFWQLNQTSDFVSVDVTDCYIGSNQSKGIVVDVNSNGPVQGYANFERCIIESQPGNAIFSNKRESLALSFKDMVIRNVGINGGNYDMPIFIQKQYDYSGFPLGNLTFDNIFIDDHLFTRDFLNISHWGESIQVENVSGNFSVYNPNGVSYYIEPPLVDVNVTVQSIDSLPLAVVNIYTNDDTAYETGNDTTATFTVSRTADDISFPLGVYFDVSGTADNRLDYHYFPETLVIPANSLNTTYTITAVKDELTEPVESIDLTIIPDTHYSISDGSTQLFIGYTILGINENKTKNISFNIYPNPSKNFITIGSEFYELKSVKIYNILGQLIKTFYPQNNRIDISFLNSGVYFLLLNSTSEKVVYKFVKK
ncbi:MAG TPA: T9SS type A sorting domain-containing protein [Caldithrix abyssi]|uniref:T9SS type A sorting domain-containing protein n=1 Tax=Caldithrix abyssi TaxID=187145 RepID=A0A7V4U2G3_CALAY|nr:T9SS type A sorting domain-containing protein [Caldithrix abyssi]